MNKKIIKTLYKKELLDILRDVKTIIIMIMIPLVLYPMLFFGAILLSSSLVTQSTQKEYKAAIVSNNRMAYEVTKELLENSLEKKDYHFEISNIDNASDYESLVREVNYDVIIEPLEDGECFDLKIYYMNSNIDSSTAYSMVNEIFDDYRKDTIENKIREILPEYDELTKDPFSIEVQNYATKEESTGMLIGYIMPFFMIISVLMGSFTIAIDVSVGERERGTLETLMTLPVNNLEMMLAKFLAVSTMATGSVVLNVASFAVMGLFVGNSMKMVGMIFGGFKFASFIPSILLMIPLLLLFIMFVSAVCLCFDFTAKSVKEANNLTTPILLIFLLASGAAVIPTVKLDYKTALIPIINVPLLIKDLFMLNFKSDIITIVFVSTLLYTVIAIVIMTKLFSSEDILFGEGVRSFRLFEKRANMKKGQIPGIGDIVFMFALVFILSNYIGSGVIASFKLWGVAVGQLVMLIVPIAYAWYIKADMRKLYSLNVPRLCEIIGAILMSLAARIMLNPILGFLINKFPKMYEGNESITNMMSDASLATALFVVAFLPAVAEEVVFRGFFFGSLINKKKIPVWAVCVITAVVFAAFHMNLYQFTYVTFLGLIMSYLIYNSESIFVTAIFHLLNNGMSVIFEYSSWFQKNLSFLNHNEYDPKSIIISLTAGTVLLIVGFFLSDRRFGVFRKKKVD